jgi:hypothetical protein
MPASGPRSRGARVHPRPLQGSPALLRLSAASLAWCSRPRTRRHYWKGHYAAAAARCRASISSILGALARPSSRATTRLPLTSTSVGTADTRSRSTRSPCVSTSIRSTRRRMRSFRARCARRLSIRRAGPERSDQKKSSKGLASVLSRFVLLILELDGRGGAGSLLFPANRQSKLVGH